ncbi:hypothetical protein IQ255_11395 [Pleurocapsales cyanobacterium LEGE 10410]|nr:hypothetical protein [Pleurocapsales cyanobacterium LEGE 10410]
MRTRRRRKGFDEERKRQLKQDLKRHFLLSKKIATNDNNSDRLVNSEAATETSSLSPETELERSQSGNSFGDVSIFPEQSISSSEEAALENPSQSESWESLLKPKESEFAPQQEEQAENESLYSKLGLQQLQEQEEARQEQLYTEQTQYLFDLPAALESANQGHILEAFDEPFTVLEELLYMAQWENPELDALQRLWLVWGKWETYYAAWHSVIRNEARQLPGRGRESWSDRFQERGLHDLSTTHLESTILRVMRREIVQKSAQEQEMNKIPTHHQLHCYFLGLRRQDWDATSWQRPTPNGADWLREDDDLKDLLV